MNLILKILTTGCFVLKANCREICFENYGCFIDTYPFGGTTARPIAFLPDHPDEIDTKFRLFNRKTSLSGQHISPINLDNDTDFNSTLSTKFIIHGFIDSSDTWVLEMKNELLKLDDMNVICVDWSSGSHTFYTQAVANTQVVGRVIAKLIKALIKKYELTPNDFHLIGHSLGAHIAGYAGNNNFENVTGINRITGLDPASPYFENTNHEVRLNSADANYVDIIHTDSSTLGTGFGILPQIGHTDFYVNNGRNQPGCMFSEFMPADVCSHNSAYRYFISSINGQCKFDSYPCESYDDFLKGDCIQCGSENCNRMGYWSSKNSDQGKLYLNTNSIFQNEIPHCKQNYQIILVSPDKGSNKQACGVFELTLLTEKSLSRVAPVILDNADTSFKERSIETLLLSLDHKLNEEIESVAMSYTRNFNWLFNEKMWYFEYITVFSGASQKEVKLCPMDNLISNKVQYSKC